MRHALLSSTATICLLLAGTLAFAQGQSDKSDKKDAAPPAAAAPAQAQPQRGAAPEHAAPQRGSEQSAPRRESIGQGSPEPSRAQGDRPAAAPSAPSPRSAEQDKPEAKPEGRGEQRQSEQPRRASPPTANAPAAKDQSRTGSAPDRDRRSRESQTTPSQQQPKQPASTQSQQQTPSTQRSTTTQQQPAAQQQQPAAQQSTTQQNQQPSSTQQSTTTSPSTSTSTTAQQPGTSAATTATVTSTGLPAQQTVRISETFSRTRLAGPVVGISIGSIRIGAPLTTRVRLAPLPREVWLVEPRYRGYSYFVVEDEIVIVEPRSQRVVSMVPRDPQRARTLVSGGAGGAIAAGGMATGSTMAAGGPPPCRIMKRDANGQLTEVNPGSLARATTGGGGNMNAPISITVQTQNGQMTPPIPLDAPAGQIVASTQGPGDCQVTIEPAPR